MQIIINKINNNKMYKLYNNNKNKSNNINTNPI